MKKSILLAICTFFSLAMFAQKVNWTYKTVSKGNNTYAIVATAAVPAGWHIYSTATPEGGPVPTSFTFKKNPLVQTDGKVAEKGALQTTHDKNFGVDVKFYSNKVEFIQNVKVKGKVKTNVNGSVEYMICNDHQCLPPVTENFSVKL